MRLWFFFPSSLLRLDKHACWKCIKALTNERVRAVRAYGRETIEYGIKYAENRKSNSEWKASGTQHTNNNAVRLWTLALSVCVCVLFWHFSEQSKRNGNNKNNDGGKERTFVFVKCTHSARRVHFQYVVWRSNPAASCMEWLFVYLASPAMSFPCTKLQTHKRNFDYAMPFAMCCRQQEWTAERTYSFSNWTNWDTERKRIHY